MEFCACRYNKKVIKLNDKQDMHVTDDVMVLLTTTPKLVTTLEVDLMITKHEVKQLTRAVKDAQNG